MAESREATDDRGSCGHGRVGGVGTDLVDVLICHTGSV